MAIAALSSMKAASSNGGGNGKPASLPPISSLIVGDDMANGHSEPYANGHRASGTAGGLQYSYVPATTNGHHLHHAGNSSTSTASAMTHSTATTPSVMTATSVSSPGTPPYERENGSSQHHVQPDHYPDNGEEGFIGRVAQFPLVSGTLKLYERGRNSNRVVKVSLSQLAPRFRRN